MTNTGGDKMGTKFLGNFLALAILLTAQTASASFCQDFLTNRLKAARNYLSLKSSVYKSPTEHRQRLEELTRMELGEIFPDTKRMSLPGGGNIEVTDINPKAIEKFEARFNELIDEKVRFRRMTSSEAKDFRQWLKTKFGSQAPPVRNDMDAIPLYELVKKQATLDNLLDFYHDIHLAEVTKDPVLLARLMGRLAYHPLSLAIGRAFNRLSESVRSIAGTAFLFGTVVAVWNALTMAVISPITRGSEQLGAMLLGRVAILEQEAINWVMRPRVSEKDAAQAREDIKNLSNELLQTHFANMTQKEVEETTQAYEKRMFTLLTRYTQVTGPLNRDARGLYRDLITQTPLSFATSLSVFMDQYTMNERFLLDLQKQIAQENRKPTKEERALLERYKWNMEDAERRYAGALVVHRLTKFLYRADMAAEIPPELQDAETKANMVLADAYSKFTNYMRFDSYSQAFQSHMLEILHLMEAGLPHSDKLVAPNPNVPKAPLGFTFGNMPEKK